MTIEDLIDASITLQGRLIVRVYDDVKTVEVFNGEAEDLDLPEYSDEAWFCEHEISFIYGLHQEGIIGGWCIEVQPTEA